ncbi:Zn2Cys6 transcriptional regulator [Trichoderma guizhouense]|uniref:Zn2Cys6 transcriptional regulator n=1 Tax=Trichoderma guizhouense TaxID=1491466 RepID=A0A1T3CB57_9HYPO|nr:Zn2Cys6 transcriptional regulator [Trichoderma guizhouense]
MTFITQPSNPTPPLHPGPPQAYSNSARCAFDFNWSRKELLPEESAVRSRAYPSPPMSGSPPLPLRSAHEAGGRGEAPTFYATSRLIDGLRGGPTQPSPANIRDQISPIITRPYPQEPTTRSPYSYPRPDESGRIVPYPPQHHHGMPQGVSQAPYLNSASSNSEAYPVPDRSQAVESQPFTSPKSQRKTKGHVASACVPCKKAHLRCDAQRPCSRCLGNGKEDACVDVQHKKRGRPRLRDERDARFDPTRYSHPQDAALRRPLSIYPSGMAGLSPYEDPLRRSQSYRSLEPPSNDATSREYQERSMAPDPNIYNPSYPGTPHAMEPLAYLSMEFDIVKASPMFMDIVHASSPIGNKLSDIVTPHQANFLTNLQNQLFEEQRLHEPNYLPPMLGRLDLAIKDFGFTTEDVARFRLNHLEYFSFIGYDGYTRTFPLRFGLAKEGSFYFVVFLTPTIHRRDSIPNILSIASIVNILSMLNTRSILHMRNTHSIHNTRGTLVRLIIIHPQPIKQRMETSRVLPRLILIDIGLVMALFDRHTIRLLRVQVPAQESQLIRSHNTLGLAIRHLKVTITLLVDLQLNRLTTYLLFGHSQITDHPLEKSAGPMVNDQDELILVAC